MLLSSPDSPEHEGVIRAFIDFLDQKFDCEVRCQSPDWCLAAWAGDWVIQEAPKADHILVVVAESSVKAVKATGTGSPPLASQANFVESYHALIGLVDKSPGPDVVEPLRDRVTLIRFSYTSGELQFPHLQSRPNYKIPDTLQQLHKHLISGREKRRQNYREKWLKEEVGRRLLTAIDAVRHPGSDEQPGTVQDSLVKSTASHHFPITRLAGDCHSTASESTTADSSRRLIPNYPRTLPQQHHQVLPPGNESRSQPQPWVHFHPSPLPQLSPYPPPDSVSGPGSTMPESEAERVMATCNEGAINDGFLSASSGYDSRQTSGDTGGSAGHNSGYLASGSDWER